MLTRADTNLNVLTSTIVSLVSAFNCVGSNKAQTEGTVRSEFVKFLEMAAVLLLRLGKREKTMKEHHRDFPSVLVFLDLVG